MGTHADKDDDFFSGLPYQEPIRFNVTLQESGIFPRKQMRPAPLRQG